MIKDQLEDIFRGLVDPRSPRNQKYSFISLMCIGLLGGLAGIDSFNSLADYAEAHEDSLRTLIDLPNGTPSHDTLQRIFSAIDPEQFHACFKLFTEHLKQAISDVIAIDGKTIRNSGEKLLHMVSAWCESNQLVLAQQKTDKKSNEIKAIPLLLKLLDIRGRVITIDAMGCQRDISEQIIKQEGDYVIGLKGNQKTLLEDVIAYFNRSELFNVTEWKEVDKGHGRIEERHCFVLDDIGWLQEHHHWPGLKSIAMVKSKRIIKDKETQDIRYYISSLLAGAERICKIARAHWSIENCLHWRLDVVYNEDKACIRDDNAAENMDIVRKWALNILNSQKGQSTIKSLQRKACMSFKHMKQILYNSLNY